MRANLSASLPGLSPCARTPEAKARAGVRLPEDVWFNEPTKEMALRAERYDLNYTLLQFADAVPIFRKEEPDQPDVYDPFVRK
jgi:hypothetical protein